MSCPWRAIVATNFLRHGSFIDSGCGQKIQNAFFEPLLELPCGESFLQMHASLWYTTVQTQDQIYWRYLLK